MTIIGIANKTILGVASVSFLRYLQTPVLWVHYALLPSDLQMHCDSSCYMTIAYLFPVSREYLTASYPSYII